MTTDNPHRPWMLGGALILLGLGFNLPYASLAAQFHYPDILRRPAGEVLLRFAQGGEALVLTWYLFALTALALVPVALAYGARARAQGQPGAQAAAVFGVIAGIAQAVGLIRWAIVVPVLARIETDPATDAATRAAAHLAFDLLNAYGGVAIGEHLGQIATAAWVGTIGYGLLSVAGARLSAGLGLATAAVMLVGTAEAPLIGLGVVSSLVGLVTVAAFGLLTLWLMIEGVRLIAAPSHRVVSTPGLRAPRGATVAGPRAYDLNITPE